MRSARSARSARVPRVSRIIRQVALLHLAATAPALLACGGATESPPSGDGGPRDSGTADVLTADGGPGECAVASTSTLQAGCGQDMYPLVGSAATCGAGDAGDVPLALCAKICPPEPGIPSATVTSCQVVTCVACGVGPSDVTALNCLYNTICGTGRRPAGLTACRPRRARDAVAGHLARVSYLEEASVQAFERLERELAAHGAPRELLAGATRARRDEVRHARVTRALAERAGAAVPAVRVAAGRVRGLEAIAIENAVEGCVNEAFGAAVALVQAQTAGDTTVRAAMRGIARDELRHAELSFGVARWLETKLAAPGRARVARARAKAVQALAQSLEREPPAALVAELGMPDARRARAIARELGARLWGESLVSGAM